MKKIVHEHREKLVKLLTNLDVNHETDCEIIEDLFEVMMKWAYKVSSEPIEKPKIDKPWTTPN